MQLTYIQDGKLIKPHIQVDTVDEGQHIAMDTEAIAYSDFERLSLPHYLIMKYQKDVFIINTRLMNY